MSERMTVMPEERSVEDLAEALDSAKAAGDDRAMVAALEDAHRAALVRLVRGLREDPRGKELLFELVDDPVIRLALMMHGIIRADPMTLAAQALADVRPQLQSHGGDVELDRIDDGVAYVRLSGACNGCSMSAVTMRGGVEEALRARVPGLRSVEVLPTEPGPAFVALGDIGRPRSGDWIRAKAITEFELGMVTPVTLTSEAGKPVEAVVVNLDGQLVAYVNECAHLAMPIDEAEIDPVTGTLTCPWHGYCYDALTGECQSLPGAQLEQLPLRVEDGDVWIRASS